MPTLTCDINDPQPMKGGEDIQNEIQAAVVVAKNGRVLQFPQTRAWLKGIIADPSSGELYDENANAFVGKARREIVILASGRPTSISRASAVSLHRLFLVRETAAFRDLIAKYDRDSEQQQ